MMGMFWNCRRRLGSNHLLGTMGIQSAVLGMYRCNTDGLRLYSNVEVRTQVFGSFTQDITSAGWGLQGQSERYGGVV